MSGASISKKLGISWQCPNREPHSCSLRRCPNKRKEYRRKLHEERREHDNRKNRERYHTKYKNDPASIAKRTKSWRDYAKRKGREWVRQRSKRYQKPYSELSASTRFKLRAAAAAWQLKNKDRRSKYARQWRRKNDPSVGFKQLISEARKSGNIAELIEGLGFAITRLDEAGNRHRSYAEHSKRRVQLCERDSQDSEAQFSNEKGRLLAAMLPDFSEAPGSLKGLGLQKLLQEIPE